MGIGGDLFMRGCLDLIHLIKKGMNIPTVFSERGHLPAVLVAKSFPAIRDGGVYIAVRRLNDMPKERDIQTRMVWVPDVLENTEGLYLLRTMVENGEIKLRVAGEYAPEQVAYAQ